MLASKQPLSAAGMMSSHEDNSRQWEQFLNAQEESKGCYAYFRVPMRRVQRGF
jgi:hypothetical protein